MLNLTLCLPQVTVLSKGLYQNGVLEMSRKQLLNLFVSCSRSAIRSAPTCEAFLLLLRESLMWVPL